MATLTSIQTGAFLAAFYGFGALGLAAITVFPIRLWLLLRRYSWALRANGTQREAYLVLATMGSATISLAGLSLLHVGRCLLGFHCGANAASGWGSLAAIGFWYLAFEIVAFPITRLLLRPTPT